MIRKLQQYLCFKRLLNLIVYIPYSIYHVLIFILIIICAICNYSTKHTLPLFWGLVLGFVAIVYFDIYSIKQTHEFYNSMNNIMSGDSILLLARKKFEKRMYSNINWLIIVISPLFIVPVVIYIINNPLGLPIKIFAYTALYIILSLCFIGYTQYVNLIIMAHDCAKKAHLITQYDKIRPHKTDWIVRLASLTNKQSNLFFLSGASFIALLYIITFTKFYNVEMDMCINKILVMYLWGIIFLVIVVMFPVFSLCSYISIKSLLSQLIENEINECNKLQNIVKHKRNRYFEIFQEFNQLKILMLEKMPVYPKKPLAVYALSYVIAIINFAATVQATISLVAYIT